MINGISEVVPPSLIVEKSVKKVAKAITLSGETLSGEIFVGRNYSSGEIFVTKRKIRHFRPTKSFAQ